MITTTCEDVVAFWKNEGVDIEKMYTADDITHWKIDVGQDDGRLRRPEYVGLLLQERLAIPMILSRRFQPILYTAKIGAHYADLHDPELNRRVVPLSRKKKLLEEVMTNPKTGKHPRIVALKESRYIVKVLMKAQGAGVTHIRYIVAPPGFSEVYIIEDAIKYAWRH